ncbi:MAG: hypothetical protein R3B40_13220 [Polyangiales bacterium]|nr:hypothetical protein [Myxococcales bacterium]MCB9659934.1 hypothetical protein [Sandaracinaceae bacterium]
MAKASSPLRLQADLMSAAATAGALHHRSAAEQVEYWASLGRAVSQVLSPDTLLAVQAGLVRLRVEPTEAQALDPEAVFDALERDRETGELARTVTTSTLRYQASRAHPGLLEQHRPDGTILVGRFQDGAFVPVDERGAE